MHKDYKSRVANSIDLEIYYQHEILSEFGITQPVSWKRHIKTNPDNFLHIFTMDGVKYALAFDDYPSNFSVNQNSSVKPIKLLNDEEILYVSAPGGKYTENITGEFMLFQVINAVEFEKLVNYLEASYSKLQRQWISESGTPVAIADDILQLAETASQNHDINALHSLKNIVKTFSNLKVDDNYVKIQILEEYIKILIDEEFDYEFYTANDKKRIRNEIYKDLSKEAQDTITIQKYESETFKQTVRLVSAMYAKRGKSVNEGISVAIVFKGNEIQYPKNHFINAELKKYFIKNTYITEQNVKYHMPEMLQDYRLVEGSIWIRDIFPRELMYISF